MITSTAINLLKNARLLRCSTEQFRQKVRNGHHHWSYRIATQGHSAFVNNSAVFVTGFAWWWVLWHLWTEPGHVTGEFEYPDASKWTDEELGIPEE